VSRGSTGQPPSSSYAKRETLRLLLVECQQSVKVVISVDELGDDHNIPSQIVDAYPDGIPIDLNSIWPLGPDLDSDPQRLLVTLAFSVDTYRCRIRWRAIRMIAVGVGGLDWLHDRDGDPEPPPRPARRRALRRTPREGGSPLRLVGANRSED